MTVLGNVLLGVFIGYFLCMARVDSVWWPHVGSTMDTLKAKVAFNARSNGQQFYKAISDKSIRLPINLDIFLSISLVLLLLSFVGGIVQYPAKRFH